MVDNFKHSVGWDKSQWICTHVRRTDLTIFNAVSVLLLPSWTGMHIKAHVKQIRTVLQHALAVSLPMMIVAVVRLVSQQHFLNSILLAGVGWPNSMLTVVMQSVL